MKENSSAEQPKIKKMGFEGRSFRKTNPTQKRRIKELIKNLPRKSNIDFLIGLLTVPILLTAIITNITNLQNANKKTETLNPSPTQPVQVVIKQEKEETSEKKDTIPPSTEICKKEIGPISISYPEENAEITENPINFIINHEDDKYCSVVWSYRINGGNWSEYTKHAPSIYNLENGTVRFELRVQSTASDDETTLTRNFIYKGKFTTPSPTAATTPTISAQ